MQLLKREHLATLLGNPDQEVRELLIRHSPRILEGPPKSVWDRKPVRFTPRRGAGE